MTNATIEKFIQWVDKHLSRVGSFNIKAYNFNLYESCEEDQYDIQIVGASYYDSENDDWACDIVFSSGEDIFTIKSEDWEIALEECKELIIAYSNLGKLKHIFHDAERVTAGFVDGELEIVL